MEVEEATSRSALREKLIDAGRSLQNVFANRGLRRIELAFAGSIVGDWAYAVAVALYAYEHGGPTAVGVLGVIRYLSLAIVTPLTSTLADRYPRPLVMISSDAIRAVLVEPALGVDHSRVGDSELALKGRCAPGSLDDRLQRTGAGRRSSTGFIEERSAEHTKRLSLGYSPKDLTRQARARCSCGTSLPDNEKLIHEDERFHPAGGCAG